MNTLSLVVRIVAIIAGIAAGALFFATKGKLEEQNAQLVSTQGTLAATTSDLSDTKADVVKLTGQLKTAERQAERLSAQLQTARNEADTKNRELSSTTSKLDSANTKIASLEKSVKRLNIDIQTANDALIVEDKGEEIQILKEKGSRTHHTKSKRERRAECARIQAGQLGLRAPAENEAEARSEHQ